MKATEQYFPLVPFIMLYMVILNLEPVDEIILNMRVTKLCSSLMLFIFYIKNFK